MCTPNQIHAFSHSDDTPITISYLSKTLKQCIRILGLKGFYDTHSFQIGKTTDMALQGYSEQQIIPKGHWDSDAHKLYIQPDKIHIPPVISWVFFPPVGVPVALGHCPWLFIPKVSSQLKQHLYLTGLEINHELGTNTCLIGRVGNQ